MTLKFLHWYQADNEYGVAVAHSEGREPDPVEFAKALAGKPVEYAWYEYMEVPE